MPGDYLPHDCLPNGIIAREHLKTILANFHFDDIVHHDEEFEKLWSKFDLDNTGMVRSNVFLRLLEYRTNLADEIDADIQRLVSRSSTTSPRHQTTHVAVIRHRCRRINEAKAERINDE